MKTMKKLALGVSAFALPMLAFAQSSGASLSQLQQFVQSIGKLVALLLPIVVAIALLAFFWGLAKFIFAAGDEEAKEKGKNIMIWGIIALFVMVSVWGLVGFIGQQLGISTNTGPQQVPTVNFTPGA